MLLGEGALSKCLGWCFLGNGGTWQGGNESLLAQVGLGVRVRLGMGLAALAFSLTQKAAFPHQLPGWAPSPLRSLP